MIKLTLTHLRKLVTALIILVVAALVYELAWPTAANTNFTPGPATVTKVSVQNIPHKTEAPSTSMLVIPRIGLAQAIHEGSTDATLDQGVWHIPNTGTASQGNMVLAGHSATFTGKGTFYYLPKVRVNDQIAITESAQQYRYKVTAIKVVPPTATEIQAPTANRRLTLYTCTPIWTSTNRLVVQAEPL